MYGVYTIVDIIGNRHKLYNNETGYNKRKLMSHNDLFNIYRVREEKPQERKKEVKQKILRDGGEFPPIIEGKRERKQKKIFDL